VEQPYRGVSIISGMGKKWVRGTNFHLQESSSLKLDLIVNFQRNWLERKWKGRFCGGEMTGAYSGEEGGEPAPPPALNSANRGLYTDGVCFRHPNECQSVMFGKYGRDFSATGAPRHALQESGD